MKKLIIIYGIIQAIRLIIKAFSILIDYTIMSLISSLFSIIVLVLSVIIFYKLYLMVIKKEITLKEYIVNNIVYKVISIIAGIPAIIILFIMYKSISVDILYSISILDYLMIIFIFSGIYRYYNN